MGGAFVSISNIYTLDLCMQCVYCGTSVEVIMLLARGELVRGSNTFRVHAHLVYSSTSFVYFLQ